MLGPGVDADETRTGAFRSLSVGRDYTCGVTVGGGVECWDVRYEDAEVIPPPGKYRSVSVYGGYACGLKTSDRLVCWGWTNYHGRKAAPYLRFQAVSAGINFACGIRLDAIIASWGHDDDQPGPAAPPAGKFQSISAAAYHACALRNGGTLVCWGDSSAPDREPPMARTDHRMEPSNLTTPQAFEGHRQLAPRPAVAVRRAAVAASKRDTGLPVRCCSTLSQPATGPKPVRSN